MVDDHSFAGYSLEQLLPLLPVDLHAIALVADQVTFATAEHAMLVVNLDRASRGATFRALPHTLAELEANLTMANMDWSDFAGGVEEDGVLRSDIFGGLAE